MQWQAESEEYCITSDATQSILSLLNMLDKSQRDEKMVGMMARAGIPETIKDSFLQLPVPVIAHCLADKSRAKVVTETLIQRRMMENRAAVAVQPDVQ